MFADNCPASHRVYADLVLFAPARMTARGGVCCFAGLFLCRANGRGNCKCCATWGIALYAMVRLNDFNVVSVVQKGGGNGREFEEQKCPKRYIACKEHRYAFARLGNALPLSLVVPRCGDEYGHFMSYCIIKRIRRCRGRGEVHNHVAGWDVLKRFEDRVVVVFKGGFVVNSKGNLKARIALDSMCNRTAHPTVCTVQTHADFCCICCHISNYDDRANNIIKRRLSGKIKAINAVF